MKDDKVFHLLCHGLDEVLTFSYDPPGDRERWFYLSYSILSFYTYQQPIRNYFRRMFKMIWCAITGKEYRFFDIVILPDRLEEFKKFVANL